MPEGLAEGTMRKLCNAAEAKTFRLPERRDETGLRGGPCGVPKGGNRDQGAANAGGTERLSPKGNFVRIHVSNIGC